MAREFFKNLPDTTTPLNAQRMNAFLNGEEAMGSIVVDDIKSKNMFNKYDVIDGYYWATGKLTKDSAMCCTNSFIKVEPNKTYTFSCGTKSTIFIEEYDENQTYIKLNSNWDLTKVSITTSSTTEYVKLSFTKAAKDTTQFEKGTATEYKPYQNLEGKTDIITGQECPTNEYEDGERTYCYKYSLTSPTVLNQDIEVADLPSGFKKLKRIECVFYFGGYQVPAHGGVNGFAFVNSGKLQMVISNQAYSGNPVEIKLYYSKN